MRLGLSSALEHKMPGEWAGKMAELGCRTVNFPVDYTSSPEIIRDYVKAAREKGLQIGEVGAWCNPIALDENQRREGLKRCKEQLALADSIGACCCVNVSGSRGSRWDGAYRDNLTEEAWREMVKSIREILDDVRPAHTFYTIEPMPWMYPTWRPFPAWWKRSVRSWAENISQCIWMFLTGLPLQNGIFIMKNLWRNALISWGLTSKAAI